jgi:predicted nucleic acid-binding protein
VSSNQAGLLLDTSVLIDPPASGLPPTPVGLAVSVVTIAELQYGVAATFDPLEQEERRRRVQRITTAFDILLLDTAITEVYGTLTALVRVGGRSPRARRFDLLIAATAVRHGLDLATRNPDDFLHLERALTVVPVEA